MELQIHSKLRVTSYSRKYRASLWPHEPIRKISCQSLMCAVKEAEGWCGVVHGRLEGSRVR